MGLFSLATNSDHLLILGDFNIHCDCQRNADTKQLADILRYVSFMLSNHFLVNINVSLQKQAVSSKVISYRRYKLQRDTEGIVSSC